jgi:hypothetical protein
MPAWPRGMGGGADGADATGADWSVTQPASNMKFKRTHARNADFEKPNERIITNSHLNWELEGVYLLRGDNLNLYDAAGNVPATKG